MEQFNTFIMKLKGDTSTFLPRVLLISHRFSLKVPIEAIHGQDMLKKSLHPAGGAGGVRTVDSDRKFGSRLDGH